MKTTRILISTLALWLFIAMPPYSIGRDWVGTSALWSVAGNWSPVGPPQNGEVLVFDCGSCVKTMQNDLQGLVLGGIVIFEGGYTLTGNPILLTNNQLNWINGEFTLECPITLLSDIRILVTPGSGLFDDVNELYLRSPINLNGHNLLLQADSSPSDQDAHGEIYCSGAISGVGNVTAEAIVTGVVEFSGGNGNTFNGTLTTSTVTGGSGGPASEGVIYLSKTSGVAVPNRLISLGRTFYSAPNQVGDQGTIDVQGQVYLRGHNDTILDLVMRTGLLDTGSGTLSLAHNFIATNSSSPNTPIVRGKMNLLGTHLFEVGDDDAQIEAILSGTGFSKNGNGTLKLSGVNTFTGQINVLEGSVEADSDSAFGSPANGVVLDGGGSITLLGVAIGNEPLTVSGSELQFTDTYGSLLFGFDNSSWAGPVTLNTNLVIYSGDTTIFSGVISGPGGLDIFYDTVRLSGSSGNTYSGTTRVLAGTLELQKTSGNAIVGPLIVGDALGGPNVDVVRLLTDTVLGNIPVTVRRSGRLDLNNFDDDIGSLTLSGGNVITGTGMLTVTDDVTSLSSTKVSSIDGKLNLGGVTRAFIVGDGSVSPDLLITATMSNGGIAKSGAGEMLLSGPNTYSFQVAVNEGQLTLASSGALGAINLSPVSVNGTGVLAIDGSFSFSKPLVLNSTAPASFIITNGNVTWSGDIALSQNITIDVSPASSWLESLGAISGPGTLTKTGPGQLYFNGSVANTFTNITWVKQGHLLLNNLGVNQAVVGPLIIGDGIGGPDADIVYIGRVRQIANTVPVTINSSGQLYILSGKSDAFGSLSGTGNVVFEGAGTLEVGLDDGSSTFDGIISGPGAFWKEGAGTLTLNGNNTYTGTTFVDGSGTLIVNGSQAQSPVTLSGGATLGGSGTVGAIAANNGIISPGASAGILKCSSVTLDASCIFRVELNGTTAGTGHDRLDVGGTVSLSDATLNATLGFASAVSNTFRIVNKTVGGAIFTTFAGLAEGATFNISGIPFQISYTGGSGNDVVLTQLLPPPSLNALQVAGTNLTLYWPSSYTGFRLESNTNLSSNVWTVVVPPAVLSGTNYVVTNNITEPQRFFRLRFP